MRCPVQQLGYVAIIAEDLGVITTDVNELRKAIGAPGMVVLQFAWGSGATNTHIPHNHYENSVCYPGRRCLTAPCQQVGSLLLSCNYFRVLYMLCQQVAL